MLTYTLYWCESLTVESLIVESLTVESLTVESLTVESLTVVSQAVMRVGLSRPPYITEGHCTYNVVDIKRNNS